MVTTSAMQQAYKTANNYNPKSMSLAGAGISAASGLLGGLINKIGQKKTEKRQVAYQKELADYQYSKDLDMWSKSNEYNKPGAQMERLKEAGLNPHLVYGTGSVTGNTAPASSPKYQNPGTQFKNVPAVDPQAVLGNYINLKQSQQNIATQKANENLINAKTGTEFFNSALKNNTARKLGIEVQNMPELYRYQFGIKQGTLNQQAKQLENTIQSTKRIKSQRQMQEMINKRAKEEKIYPGDNAWKVLLNMLSPGKNFKEHGLEFWNY